MPDMEMGFVDHGVTGVVVGSVDQRVTDDVEVVVVGVVYYGTEVPSQCS